MCFLRGGPFFNYISILVKDLNGCTLQLFAGYNINLRYFNGCDAVDKCCLCSNRGHRCQRISRNSYFTPGILNLITILVFRKSFNRLCPVVLLSQCYCLSITECSIKD